MRFHSKRHACAVLGVYFSLLGGRIWQRVGVIGGVDHFLVMPQNLERLHPLRLLTLPRVQSEIQPNFIVV